MTLVDSFKTGTYTVTRMEGSGTFVDGSYIPGKTYLLKVIGSLQPTLGKDLLVIEELYRVRQTFALFTNKELKTAKEVGLKNADRVQVNSEPFVVMTSERWTETDLPYFKAILMRENVEVEK